MVLKSTIKNFGLDESGKLSDEIIYFARVEIDEKDEQDVFINILSKTGGFFYSSEVLNNTKPNTILSYCKSLLENKLIKVVFYKLSPTEQIKILNDTYRYQANYLFRSRSDLLSMFKKDKVHKVKLRFIISQLQHYRKYSMFPDTCMKSYAYLYILNEMGNNMHIGNYLKEDDNYINIQIDGGHFFSFWWHDLINYHENMEILRNKLFIKGVAHGDECYLPMNIADLFSRAFKKSPMKFFSYDIREIKYDFKDLPISNDNFYRKLWTALSKNIFKKRLLVIGKSQFFNILVHVMHRKNRKINYEPFVIHGDIKYFFRKNSKGFPDNNIVVYGEKLNDTDKDNLQKCENRGIEILSIKDLHPDYINFFDVIESTLDNYDDSVQSKIKGILKEKRENIEKIQEVDLQWR